jgi:hypothetical protein
VIESLHVRRSRGIEQGAAIVRAFPGTGCGEAVGEWLAADLREPRRLHAGEGRERIAMPFMSKWLAGAGSELFFERVRQVPAIAVVPATLLRANGARQIAGGSVGGRL